MTVAWTRQKQYPVESVLAFLMIWGKLEGPLFQYMDGHSLTRARSDVDLKKALGQDTMVISTHTFRIGAATTAAQRGVEGSAMKDLGRWKSSAYLRYINQTGPRSHPGWQNWSRSRRGLGDRRTWIQCSLMLCHYVVAL